MISRRQENWVPASFFPVSPLMIFPEALGSFSVFLRQENNFVLYTKSGQKFTENHRNKLYHAGVDSVFVQTVDKPAFDQYVEENLGTILTNESLPLAERSKVFCEATASVIQEVFNEKLPVDMTDDQFDRINKVVRDSVTFLAGKGALKAIGPFISHDYKTYSHSMHVFIYSVSLMHHCGVMETDTYDFGLGALLHDIGKTRVPLKILNKKGSLTKDERLIVMTHSLKGVAMCANLSVSKKTVDSILFHHERMDGKGYPTGISGDDIPSPVRMITLCDVYDALTSDRPYAKGMRPFDALNVMRHEMQGAFDMELYRKMVEMLAGADLMGEA